MKNIDNRLYRSEENKVVFGIMGGLGERFDIDPTILRVFYIFISVFTAIFPGILAYFLMALVIPKKTKSKTNSEKVENTENTK